MAFKKFSWILVFTVVIATFVVIYLLWDKYNPLYDAAYSTMETSSAPLDSLLSDKQYDLYVRQIERSRADALANLDTAAYLKTGVKLMFAYKEYLPKEDSLRAIYDQSLPWATAFSDQKYRYNFNFLWASYLGDKGNYTEAMSLLQGIGPIIEAKQYDFLPHYYDTFAKLHYRLGDYERAFELLKKELAIFEKTDNFLNLSSTYNNLGILYKNVGVLDSSLHYHTKSIEISKQLKDSLSIAKSYNNIGSLYLEQKDILNALTNFEKAFNTNPQHPTSAILTNYSQLLFATGKAEAGEKMLWQVAKNSMSLSNRLEAYEKLQEHKEQFGQYSQALEIAKTIKQLEKEHLGEIKIKEIEKLKASYELETKEAVIQQLREKEALQTLIAKQRGILAMVLLILCVVLIAFGIGWFRNTKEKAAREQLILEQRLLRSQMNPHFIFNVLTNIQNTVMDNHPLHAALSISRFAKLIRQNFDFIQKEFISLDEELDALQNYADTQKMRFHNSFEYSTKLEIQDPIEELQIPPLLLQPLVENAIEHGIKGLETKGRIELAVTQTDEFSLHFRLTDNGVGYQSKIRSELHALDILKTRLRMNNPMDEKSFEIQNQVPQGTSVSFTLTLKNV